MTLTACSGGDVQGTPEPAAGSATAAPSGSEDLDSLLIDPSAFPGKYDAIVLPPQAIAQASPDLTGIPAGAEVSPAGCKPKDVVPGSAALIVGTDNANRATISIELTSVDEPLSVREDQLTECAEVEATKSGATSKIRSTITPAPPIDADETLAVRQTVSSGTGTESVTQSMLTLMAQVGGVRIAATHMSFDAATPDAETLDELFTAAVQKVKAG
ncbi:sensor domain-containing protein [Rhodococcus sp. G-MC3]|uniref:sensor domain-containing protein n=1 Tax=Rhodococcus sp. G-MC3 TaxID=3046209 RepID=UPI0024B8D11E|nr:sensor domain-containing protein [Rhodococcus sp. G-MC3]MDJ0391747.1 sensor domain-containing protein [Rhodococcus sp. G-MC3]